jgi:CheY-like chemotaxis protein
LLILVVDDEPDVEELFRQQFRRDLRAGRYTMEFAQSAPAALQQIGDAAGVSLILILSDINMPGMSGLELLPKAKALRPDVPVIMITAYGDAETKRKAFEGGAEALLTKPIDFAALRKRNRHPSRASPVIMQPAGDDAACPRYESAAAHPVPL